MRKEQVHEIALHLDDIKYLFADPGPDSDMFVSGLDYLYSEIKAYPRQEKFKVIIVLPQGNFSDDQDDKTRQKLKRFCSFKIEESRRELIALHRQGVAALLIGLVVLLTCVLLAFAFSLVAQSGVNEILKALSQIITVLFAASAGWVALWMPAEIFLYDWWPFRQDMRIYKQIANADLIIREIC